MIQMTDLYKIGNITISNRLVASAMFEFGADEGKISPRIIDRYDTLSKGGAGLIITGMQAISKNSSIGSIMVETSYDKYVEDMKNITAIVHKNGSRLFVQLNHAGYKTNWSAGGETCGVSDFAVNENCTYHEATINEIRNIVEDFGKAAKKCKEAGCDGVQIHASHGYLINTFLSPYYNHRTDSYGGKIENRARLLFEVYTSIQKNVGMDYPVSVKFPFSDLTEPSISAEESIWVCKELEKLGVDMIEVTSGLTYDTFTPLIIPGKNEGVFLSGASKIAEAVNIPIVSVCGYRTPDYIEKALNTTKITAVSLGRPLVCEPNLPIRWAKDRSQAMCKSCNRCFRSNSIITCQISN